MIVIPNNQTIASGPFVDINAELKELEAEFTGLLQEVVE